jgi:diphthine-ammonia ligase
VSPELKQSYVSCGRLSLTPLCYLWQRDQAELLSEMIDTGMEAVLIKVAGIGLKPSHLGKTLTEMQPTLFKLVITFPDIKMVD